MSGRKTTELVGGGARFVGLGGNPTANVKGVLREEGARMAQWDFSEVEKRLTPVRIIHFKDDGQDFLRWYVAANGVVVCSEPFQTFVWAGTVMLNVRVGRFPTVRSNEGHIRTVKHRVTKVEELTHGKA